MEQTEQKKEKGGGFALQIKIWITIILIFLTLVVGLAGFTYWKRDEIRTRICDTNQLKVVFDDAFSLLDCEYVDTSMDVEESISFPVVQLNEEELTEVERRVNALVPDVSAVYEKVNESVVGIGISSDRNGSAVIGTGFIVSTNGLIATNQHVVSSENAEYFVKLPNSDEVLNVVNIYRDVVNDIALIEVDRKDLPAIPLNVSESVRPGQPVIAIGNPLGELSSSVTSGIVSAVNRSVQISEGSFLRTSTIVFEDTIQTDAAINPGNSGGPLLNANGEVIAINFATIQGADNLSFAIPVSYLQTRIDELNEFGRFRIPYVGIQYTSELVRFGSEVYVGARVVAVDPNGSATDIVEVGDVIIEVNGRNLENSSFAFTIQKQQIGSFIDIELIRGTNKVIEVVEIVERSIEE